MKVIGLAFRSVFLLTPGVALLALGRAIQPPTQTSVALMILGGVFFAGGVWMVLNGIRELGRTTAIGRLQLYVGFTKRDLAANRNGKLTVRQRLIISFGTVFWSTLILLTGVLFIGIAIVEYASTGTETPISFLYFILFGFVTLVVGGQRLYARFRDFREGVEQVTGNVVVYTGRKLGTASLRGVRTQKVYYLRVEHKTTREVPVFPVDVQTYQLLHYQPEVMRYTVYYLQRSKILLSLEPEANHD